MSILRVLLVAAACLLLTRESAAQDLTGTLIGKVELDPRTRSPRTDAYSLGVDREAGLGVTLSTTFVHKSGRDFIGWEDVASDFRSSNQLRTTWI